MKRSIAAVLIITILTPAALFAQPLPAGPAASDGLRPGVLVPLAEGELSNTDSYNEGVMAAEDQHTALGWGFGGFFAGTFLSWLGTGVTVLIANGSRPTPRYIPEEVDAMNYRNGYADEARRRNVRSAAIPGVIMSTLWTVLVLSAAAQ
ncbi:MAG: hypothetical protein ACLFSV_07350 [Alkalispirochaeta sp.]